MSGNTIEPYFWNLWFRFYSANHSKPANHIHSLNECWFQRHIQKLYHKFNSQWKPERQLIHAV